MVFNSAILEYKRVSGAKEKTWRFFLKTEIAVVDCKD